MRRRSLLTFVGYFLTTLVTFEGIVMMLSYQAYQKVLEDSREVLTANAGYKLALTNMLVDEKVQQIEQTLSLLSGQGALRDYLIKSTNGRRGSVEQLWQTVVAAAPVLQRVSLVELNGHERFGVQQIADGSVTALTADQLRQVGDPDALEALKQLAAGELYLPQGKYRLDRAGRPATPLELMITAITPIEFANRRVGFLLLEVSSARLANRLQRMPTMVVGDPMILDSSGYYRLHSDINRVAGDLYPERRHYNFKNDYPEAWAHLQQNATKEYASVFRDVAATFVFALLQSEQKERRRNYIVFHISEQLVGEQAVAAIERRNTALTISSVLVLIIAVIIGGIGGSRAQRLHQQRLAEAMVESMSAVVVTDRRGVVQDVNPSFERITGYYAEDIVGQLPEMLKSAEHRPLFYGRLLKRLLADGFWRGEIWCQFANGHSHPLLVEIHAIKDKRGRVINYVGSCLDLGAQKQLETDLRENSLRDPLTGCWNRRYLTDLLKNEIARQRRFGHPLALATFDIDHFKRINDQYGHDVGDQALKRCCDLVARQLRRSDSLCRVGGEEFVLVLPMSDRQGAEILIERIRTLLAEQEDEPRFSVSMGLTVALPNDDRDAMLKRADQALYEAKARGRNRSMFAAANRLYEISVDPQRLTPGVQ